MQLVFQRLVRIQAERLREILPRALMLSLLAVDPAAACVRVGPFFERDRLVEIGESAVVVAGVPVNRPAGVQGPRVRRIEPDRFPVIGERAFDVVPFMAPVAAHLVERHKLGALALAGRNRPVAGRGSILSRQALAGPGQHEDIGRVLAAEQQEAEQGGGREGQ